LISELSWLKELRCHTPPRQFVGAHSSNQHGSVLSIHVLAEIIVVIYADFSVGTYRWAPFRSGSMPFTFKMDKIKTLGCRDMSSSPVLPQETAEGSENFLTSSSLNRDLGFVDSGGVVAAGNWSFGMTLGGSIKDIHRRRLMMGKRGKEVPLSVYDASALLLSCGYWDDTVKSHSVDSLRLKCSENGGHRGAVNCLSIGSDGGLMVTGGQDATCRVWVIDHNDMSIALTDGYVQTALGTNDEDSILNCCHVLWGHSAPVTCLSFSSDLDVVVSGAMDGVICVHTVRQGKFIRKIHTGKFFSDVDSASTSSREKEVFVKKLALNDHGRFVAHLEDGMLQSYTINGVKLGCADAGEKLNAMEICSDGEMLVTGGESCHVVIRTLSDLIVRCVLDLSTHGPIRCISITPDDLNPAPQVMYIGTDDGKVTIVDRDLKSKSKRSTLEDLEEEDQGLTYLEG